MITKSCKGHGSINLYSDACDQWVNVFSVLQQSKTLNFVEELLFIKWVNIGLSQLDMN